MFERRAVLLIPCVGFVVLSGCANEVSGRVTDVQTGRSIPDAQIGLIRFPPFSILPIFPEYARSDAQGEYQFVHTENDPWMYVWAPGYLSQAQLIPSTPMLIRDIRMQSIAGLVGDWNVSITIDGQLLGETTFTFTENGVEWHSEFGFVGTFTFEIDGNKVVVHDQILDGGLVVGEVEGEFELNGMEDQLAGPISIDKVILPDGRLVSGLDATFVAVRAD